MFCMIIPFSEQLQLGTLFHSSLQEYLQVTPKDESVLEPELEGCWKSLERVLPRISTVKLLESHVVHEKLKYRGIIDCIAVYRYCCSRNVFSSCNFYN